MSKFIRNSSLFIVVCGLFSVVAVFGQLDGNPANLCRNGFFPRESESYRLGLVNGKKGERVYFYGDEREDCPGGKDCRLKSYVIPGNEVIVSRTLGSFACAWFQPVKGSETVGWIKTDSLLWSETNEAPAPAAWFGKWTYATSTITIAKSKTAGFFDVKGDSYWKGLGDNIHIGEIGETVKPAGDRLKLGEKDAGEYDCKVSMQLLGKYLIVADNMYCGGANVTFSGVYRRAGVKR